MPETEQDTAVEAVPANEAEALDAEDLRPVPGTIRNVSGDTRTLRDGQVVEKDAVVKVEDVTGYVDQKRLWRVESKGRKAAAKKA